MFMDRWWVKLILYPLFSLFAFLFLFWLMLPMERVKGIAENKLEEAMGYRYNVALTTVALSGLNGIEATDIEITSKPPPPNLSEEEKKAFKRVKIVIDRLEANVSLLSLIAGDVNATYVVEMGGGSIEGSYAQTPYEPVEAKPPPRAARRRSRRSRTVSGKGDAQAKDTQSDDKAEDAAEDDQDKVAVGHQVDMTLNEIPLQSIGVLRAMLELPLTGTLNGELSALIGQRGEPLEGKLDLSITRTSFGPGELPFDTGFGKFKLENTVRMGDITLATNIEAGKLILQSLKSTGPDIVLEANGNLTLNPVFMRSRLKINARVKPDPKFLEANKLKAVLDLNPKVRNAKAGDWYGILISGALSQPNPFPSSRTASGLDKIKPN